VLPVILAIQFEQVEGIDEGSDRHAHSRKPVEIPIEATSRMGQGWTDIPTCPRLPVSTEGEYVPLPAAPGCPIAVAHRDGDIGTGGDSGRSRQSVSPARFGPPGDTKSRAPASATHRGSSCRAGGLGGWGVSVTVARFISSLNQRCQIKSWL
jgi:hypothetical protein